MSQEAHKLDVLLCATMREASVYPMFATRQKVTVHATHALRGRKVRTLWVTQLALETGKVPEFIEHARYAAYPEDLLVKRAEDWSADPPPADPALARLEEEHDPHEATGGYIECSCGWPTKEQWEANEPYARHIIEEYRKGGRHGSTEGDS